MKPASPPSFAELFAFAYRFECRARRLKVVYRTLLLSLVQETAALLTALISLVIILLRLILSPLWWALAPFFICLIYRRDIVWLKAKWDALQNSPTPQNAERPFSER